MNKKEFVDMVKEFMKGFVQGFACTMIAFIIFDRIKSIKFHKFINK